MATTRSTSRPITSTLGDAEQRIAGEALQVALVDLVDLSLSAKQAHWNLVGRQFRSVHLQLDDVVETARLLSDTVAERAAALGVSPDGRAATVAKASHLAGYPEGWVKDSDAVDWFVEQLGTVIGKLREQVEETEKADPVTQDLLIEIVAALEKHHWMFQAERG